MKICVIDEPLNKAQLYDLISNVSNIEIVTAASKDLQGETLAESKDSHGTLCTAVLIESLQKLNILQQVKIYHFSVGFLAGHHAEHALLEGLEFCQKNNIDLISCSIGMFQLALANSIVSLLHGIKKPLIVAASANNGHITYPASLPCVLGVKIGETQSCMPCLIHNPPDGVDLVAWCSKSSVLKKTGCEFSNSILAPQICAQVAKLALQGIPLEKEQILSALTSGNFIEDSEKPFILGSDNPDDDPPVVAFFYSEEKYPGYFSLAMQLQKEFKENGYSCAILSDRLQVADFENGHFPVKPQQVERDIAYYIHAAEHSLFLLLVGQKVPCDLQLDEKWLGECPNNTVQVLYEMILNTFPDR